MTFVVFDFGHEVDLTEANFQELDHYFDTPRAEAEELLASGLTITDIKDYKRAIGMRTIQ